MYAFYTSYGRCLVAWRSKEWGSSRGHERDAARAGGRGAWSAPGSENRPLRYVRRRIPTTAFQGPRVGHELGQERGGRHGIDHELPRTARA